MKDNEWRQLVHSALNNDKAAFERLYKETERSVYFLCLKLLGNEQDAKDIVQETYLAAYNGLSALDDGANFPKWVNGIAVNQCRKLFRAPDNESFDEKLEQGKEFADEENFIPEEYVADAEKRKVIMNMIDTELSEVQRQTVILFYYNGLKTHEIAGIMNCPEGTVKYRLSAAREKIREAVLIYEEEHKERLHAVMPIPVLTRILRSEAEQIAVPDIRLFENSAASANNYKAGGNASMKSALTRKIVAAAAVAVVGGGIAAGVALSNRDPGGIGAYSSNATADTSTETNREIGSAGSEAEGSDESSDASENAEIPVDPSSESEAPEETASVMTEDEWFTTTSLREYEVLCKDDFRDAIARGSVGMSPAVATNTFDSDYVKENIKKETVISVPEVELTADLNEMTFNGELIDVSVITGNEGYEYQEFFIYDKEEKTLTDKPFFYNIDNDLVFSIGICSHYNTLYSKIGEGWHSDYYRVASISFYDESHNLLDTYTFNDENCSRCLVVIENIASDAASYSIDFTEQFDRKESRWYFLRLEEGDEDYLYNYNIIADHGDMYNINSYGFGYDENFWKEGSLNPYKRERDTARRFFILQQWNAATGSHYNDYRNKHINLVGYSYDEENQTLTDKVYKSFTLDTETFYVAELLDEDKVWFYLND